MTDQRDEYQPKLPTDTDYIRKVAQSIERKAAVEQIHFGLLTDTLSALGITEDPYASIRADSFDGETINALVDESYQRIIREVPPQELKEKLYGLWDYLVESDPLEKAGLIFVFGGGGITRPALAAQLYKEGWAPKVLFTGHSASYMKDDHRSEAELFADVAHEQGVPTEDMILEKEAKNTPENAINSVRLLKEQGQLPEKIILVQIEYQMRRAYLTLKAVADWNPTLIRRPAPSAKYGRQEYWKDKAAWSYVFLEFIKMYGGRQMGHF